ncbi:MAG: hypothetical protein M5U26_25845 [Planctomycetota bacterium]|nr:hypothetical protein [Planctomycetota bacterium]
MTTQVIISFDTEDFIGPKADDALLRLATTLTAKGLRGSFCMVGEKARVLKARGRSDVFEALKPHEICFHSRDHSIHPTLAPRCEEYGWERGLAELRATELEAMGWVKEIFGRDALWTAVPPGANTAPQAIWLYQRAGIPIYSAGFLGRTGGRPYRYLGGVSVPYTLGADAVFSKETVEQVWARLEAQAGNPLAILCIHPTIMVHEIFWDRHNFNAGVNRPKAQWEPAPLRSDEDVERIFTRWGAFLDRIKADARFAFTDYETLLGELNKRKAARQAERWPAEAFARLAEGPDWIERDGEGGGALSAQEALGELAARLTGDRSWRDRVDPVRLPGPVLEPKVLARDLSVTRAQVLNGLWRAQGEIGSENAGLPASWRLNGDEAGPGALLAALAQFAQGRETATLKAGHPEVCAGVARTDLGAWRYGAWLFKPGFEGKRNLEIAHRMAWTLSPA